MLFIKIEVPVNKNNYATMLFMSKQFSLPKISLILQKDKNQPKTRCTLFCIKDSIIVPFLFTFCFSKFQTISFNNNQVLSLNNALFLLQACSHHVVCKPRLRSLQRSLSWVVFAALFLSYTILIFGWVSISSGH